MVYSLSMTSRIFNYKGVRVTKFGVPIFNNKKRKIIKSKRSYHPSFKNSFSENSQKNLIILYDIPDNLKKERDWFRRHLVKFGYEMIQKSVWVGPSPLPRDFSDYLEEIKIGDKFKTFKLAKNYNPSISAIA